MSKQTLSFYVNNLDQAMAWYQNHLLLKPKKIIRQKDKATFSTKDFSLNLIQNSKRKSPSQMHLR